MTPTEVLADAKSVFDERGEDYGDHAECHRNIVVDRVLKTRPNAAVVHV